MLRPIKFRKAVILGMVAALGFALALPATARVAPSPDTTVPAALDHGFTGLYNLDFTGAQKDFSAWEAEQADYAALIEKRNLASLHYTKEASTWAQQLLAVCTIVPTRWWRPVSASTSSEA